MKSVVIIGASNDRTKFGCVAVQAFSQAGWTVHAVNPRESVVLGRRAFASVADVPQPLDWISVYVPASVGITLLPEIAAARASEVWFNPGSADGALLAAAEALGLKVTSGCSIRAIGLNPHDFF